MSSGETAVATKLNRLGLKRFGSQELPTRPIWENTFGARNSRPPMRRWDNIIPTILVLDPRRAGLGTSISLQSVWRGEACNRASRDSSKGDTGRARASQHMAFSPIDFIVSGMSCTKVPAIVQTWQNEGKLFYSPVPFERKAQTGKAGQIALGELPRHWHVRPLGVWFPFNGVIKADPSGTVTHLDTRGLISVMTE